MDESLLKAIRDGNYLAAFSASQRVSGIESVLQRPFEVSATLQYHYYLQELEEYPGNGISIQGIHASTLDELRNKCISLFIKENLSEYLLSMSVDESGDISPTTDDPANHLWRLSRTPYLLFHGEYTRLSETLTKNNSLPFPIYSCDAAEFIASIRDSELFRRLYKEKCQQEAVEDLEFERRQEQERIHREASREVRRIAHQRAEEEARSPARLQEKAQEALQSQERKLLHSLIKQYKELCKNNTIEALKFREAHRHNSEFIKIVGHLSKIS